MSSLPAPASPLLPDAPFRPAEVRAARGSEVEVLLDGRVTTARLAVTGSHHPRPGDEVLVADGGEGQRYVIGILRSLRSADVVTETADGTKVRLREEEEGVVLTVESPDGAVLFEHVPSEGRSCVSAPSGSLEIRAASGDLDLTAAKRVRLRGEEGVEIRSGRSVQLEVDGAETTHFSLSRAGASLVADVLRAKLQSTHAEVTGDARLRADVIEVGAELVRTAAQVVDTRADRIVERVRESYREVEDLAQTRAGRVRIVAERAFHVLAERTWLKARRDMKLKGETIYLD